MKSSNFLNLRYFLSSLAITLLILLLFISYIIMLNPQKSMLKNEFEPTSEIYLPTKDEKLSIFMTLSENKTSPIYLAAIIKFDPVGGQIPIIYIPTKCIVKSSDINKNDILENKLLKDGISNTKTSFENYTGVNIDRYLSLTDDVLTKIISLNGDISINVPNKIKITDNFTINKGYQILDGATVCKVLKAYSTDKNIISVSLFSSELLSHVVNNILSNIGTAKGENNFKILVNNSDTDISYSDYEYRLKACKFMQKLSQECSFPLVLQGKYNTNKNTFSFSDTAIVQIKNIIA